LEKKTNSMNCNLILKKIKKNYINYINSLIP
jgi:hypothetical protein